MRLYQQRKSTLLSLPSISKTLMAEFSVKTLAATASCNSWRLDSSYTHGFLYSSDSTCGTGRSHSRIHGAWNRSNRSIVYKKYVSFVGNRESPPKKLAQMQLLQTQANRQALKISKCFCLRYIMFYLYLSSISTHELLVSQVRKEEHGRLPATIFLEG